MASATTTPARPEAQRTPRTQDPDGVKRDILAVAKDEFARKGFSGARVDEIAARTRTSKRMIYYYFGDKEGLYVAVLEDVYGNIRSVESSLDLDSLEPEMALKSLVGFTFDYQNSHPEFVRLVMIENIHEAAHMKRSLAIQNLNITVIDTLRRIIMRGEKSGVFRKGLDPIDLHMTISALCFFNVANRATFSTIFKLDMISLKALAVRRNQVIEVLLRYVKSPQVNRTSARSTPPSQRARKRRATRVD
jgi:AcrR family transcriptional regulator